MSTEPRTATVNVFTTKPLEIAEPDWCAGHPDERAHYQVDLTHYGPEQTLDFRGETLWTLMLTQSPFASAPGARSTGVYVEQGDYSHSLNPQELDDLAAALIEHAAVLRHLARELAVILAGGGH